MSYDIDAVLTNAFEPLRALEPSGGEIQAALRAAERAPRRRRRIRRRNGLVIALAALAIGGGATATLLDKDKQLDEQVRNTGPLPSSGDPALDKLIEAAKTKPGLAPVAKTFSIEARMPDPAGGPEWALVVWRTKAAGWCNEALRQRGTELGAIAPDGSFHPYPFAEGATCSERPLEPDEVGIAVTSYAGGPTLIHGVAGHDVAQVEVQIRHIPGVRKLQTSDRGGFLAVLPQETRRLTFHVTAILRDGTRKRST